MAKSHSSIFSFDTLNIHGFRIPRAALVAAGAVLCCELLLHIFQSFLPEPVVWGSGEASVKVAQVRRLAGNLTEPLDLLILGPSHASVGISPAAMLSSVDHPRFTIYNGSLNGRTYPVLEFLLREVYQPLLKPRMLVLSASPVIFNLHNSWMERNSREFFSAPMPRACRSTGIEHLWRTFLVEDLFLYRYRRRQADLSEGFLNGRRIVDRYGYHAVDGRYDDEQRRLLLASTHPYHNIMRHFEFGGPSVAAFIDILKWSRRIDIPVVVVNMPFRTDLLTISPTGQDDYAEYLRRMLMLRDTYGFRWLDYQQSMSLDDDDFRDVDHLNVPGAVLLSRHLSLDLVSYHD